MRKQTWATEGIAWLGAIAQRSAGDLPQGKITNLRRLIAVLKACEEAEAWVPTGGNIKEDRAWTRTSASKIIYAILRAREAFEKAQKKEKRGITKS